MKLWTNGSAIDGIRFVGAWVQGDEIRMDGYHSPAAHTESKLGVSMDFHDAQDLVKQLTEALKDMPCPTCGRKVKP